MKEQWDLIIKAGTIVNNSGSIRADLAVKKGKIAAIGYFGHMENIKSIDANGKLVLPGMIDAHAHIQTGVGEAKSKDNYLNGSIAAAYGGTTSFIDFAFNNEGEKPKNSMERKLKEAAGNSILDFSFHPCINQLDMESLEDIRYYLRNGFPSVKLFTVYRNSLMLEKKGIYEVLKIVAEENGISLIHAEEADIIERNISDAIESGKTLPKNHAESRPVISEIEAMYGILAMSAETKAPVIFAHMTTGASRAVLERRDGAKLFAEACPHYLVLDERVYEQEDGYNYVCSPPIRSASDREKLWQLIKDGYVQMINSDHTDYSSEQKKKYCNYFPKIPNGLPTIETRGMVFFSEAVMKRGMPVERFVALTSANAAKLMGLYPRKGVLQPGSDADIIIVDPDRKYIMRASDMHMQTDFCPYEGIQMRGKVEYTIAGGDILIENGIYTGKAHTGKLLKRGKPILDL